MSRAGYHRVTPTHHEEDLDPPPRRRPASRTGGGAVVLPSDASSPHLSPQITHVHNADHAKKSPPLMPASQTRRYGSLGSESGGDDDSSTASPSQLSPQTTPADETGVVMCGDVPEFSLLNPDGGTPRGAFINFLKSLFGAGILSIPHAFQHSGVFFGILLYLGIGVVVIATMVQLIKTKHIAQQQAWPRQVQTYPDVGRHVWGSFGEWVVHIQVVFLEVAFCSGFVIVGIENILKVWPSVTRFRVAAIAAGVLIPLSWVKWLKDLWVFSALGLLVYVLGVIGVTIVNGSEEMFHHGHVHGAVFPPIKNLILFVGVAVYSLEGVNLVLPIESSMADRRKSFPVISSSMAIYAALVAIFGAFAYEAGLGRPDIVTDSFGDGWLGTTIRLTLCASLVVTHPLTLYPATEILEQHMFTEQTRYVEAKSKALRAGLVLITCIVGWKMPDFSLFAGLIGSLMMTTVGFVLPPLFYLKVHDMGGIPVSPTVRWLSYASVAFGVLVTIVGTTESISEILDKYG